MKQEVNEGHNGTKPGIQQVKSADLEILFTTLVEGNTKYSL